jgi:hypothetical protein
MKPETSQSRKVEQIIEQFCEKGKKLMSQKKEGRSVVLEFAEFDLEKGVFLNPFWVKIGYSKMCYGQYNKNGMFEWDESFHYLVN